MTENDLADWIRNKMTVDEMSVLEMNKDIISKFIGIMKNGKPVLLVDKAKLTSQQMIVLFLIGKLMSKIAGYSDSDSARNKEIIESLGIPEGTVGRCLRELENGGVLLKGEDGGYGVVLSSLSSFIITLRGIVNG